MAYEVLALPGNGRAFLQTRDQLGITECFLGPLEAKWTVAPATLLLGVHPRP